MNPVILYDNRFADGALSATDTESGYDVNNIKDLRAHTFWKAAAPGTKYITVNCGTPLPADALAIVGHNLSSCAAIISVEASEDGITWREWLIEFTVSNDKAFLKIFTSDWALSPWGEFAWGELSAEYWRIKIVTTSQAPFIAVALLGMRMEFPFRPAAPDDPADIVPEIDRVLLMKGGRIVHEGGTELIDNVHLSDLYEVEVHVRKIDGRFIAWS